MAIKKCSKCGKLSTNVNFHAWHDCEKIESSSKRKASYATVAKYVKLAKTLAS